MENRRSRRISFREPAHFSLDEGTRARQEEGVFPYSDPFPRQSGCAGRDLSAGGMQFQTDCFVPVAALMTVTFPIGPQGQISLTGKVVWVQKLPHAESYLIGFEFDENTSRLLERMELDRFINSRN